MKLKKICIFSIVLSVFVHSFSYANINTNKKNNLDIPNINSRSAIVIDRTTKRILYGKHENDIRKMASTTKIMTAIVVIENTNLYNTVTISKNAASIGGSTLGLKNGDKITVCDLLYGLLLKSGNDTAIALAEYVGGSVESFSVLMNNKAKELGLLNTSFVTPHGLDNDNHFTTAYELALLTDYALNVQTFYNIVSTKSYTITINSSPKNITNTNELLGNLYGVYGVKTGFTNGANRCLVTACKRDNFDIICVVLGANTKNFRTQDSTKLIEYTFNTYSMIDLSKIIEEKFDYWKNNNFNRFKIEKGVTNNLEFELNDLYYTIFPIKNDYIDKISISIDCNYYLYAPLKVNTSIGYLTVKLDEDTVLKHTIVNKNYIKKKSCFYYYLEIISNLFNYLTIYN